MQFVSRTSLTQFALLPLFACIEVLCSICSEAIAVATSLRIRFSFPLDARRLVQIQSFHSAKLWTTFHNNDSTSSVLAVWRNPRLRALVLLNYRVLNNIFTFFMYRTPAWGYTKQEVRYCTKLCQYVRTVRHAVLTTRHIIRNYYAYIRTTFIFCFLVRGDWKWQV